MANGSPTSFYLSPADRSLLEAVRTHLAAVSGAQPSLGEAVRVCLECGALAALPQDNPERQALVDSLKLRQRVADDAANRVANATLGIISLMQKES